jgi:hypothetical protein
MPEALLLSAASLAGVAPTPADERLGVYVLAAIVGVLVSGLISCAKEMRKEAALRAVNRS